MRAEIDAGQAPSAAPQTGLVYLEGGRAHYVPEDGLVPDARTAIKIAEAVWVPIYGEEQIASERPFGAVLKDDVWFVSGSLNCPKGHVCVGGVAEAEIARTDGRIFRVIHGQ